MIFVRINPRCSQVMTLGDEIVVEGYVIPKDRLYTGNDEWVKIEGERARIGVTDYAQKQLKDVVGVELPETGRTVEKGEPIATIDSIKTAAEVYAPLSGQVLEVNEKLQESPELINTDPYGEGWIVVIRPSKLDDEKGSLLTPEKYAELVKKRE